MLADAGSIPAASTKQKDPVDQPRPLQSRLFFAFQKFIKKHQLVFIGLFWPAYGHSMVTLSDCLAVIHISTGEGEPPTGALGLPGGYVGNEQQNLLLASSELNSVKDRCLYLVTRAQSPMSETIKVKLT